MKLIKSLLGDVKVFKLKKFTDKRGVFSEIFRINVLTNVINKKFLPKQINIAISKKNVFRGMHYQDKQAQAKIIFVSKGGIVDYFLCLDKKSKYYLQNDSFILNNNSNHIIYIPSNFAHGYLSLYERTEIIYLTSNYYNPKHEKGINYLDKELNISLPDNVIVSDKDKALPNLNKLFKLNQKLFHNTECLICNKKINTILNLGKSPIANTFSLHKTIKKKVNRIPLTLQYCNNCYNLQLGSTTGEKDLFKKDYTYLTPETNSNTQHYIKLIKYLLSRKYINSKTNCLEIGSNNGAFLCKLKPEVKSILGVDPSLEACKESIKKQIPTICEFFDNKLINSKTFKSIFNVIICRHVFAHNRQPLIFIKNISKVMKPDGILIIENAYAVNNFLNLEFDQVYNEHMFYYSLNSINNILNSQNIHVIDYYFSSHIPNSIVFICGRKHKYLSKPKVLKLLKSEKNNFFSDFIKNDFYKNISIQKIKFKELIKSLLKKGEILGSYGATAKAFTVLTFYQLGYPQIRFCCDTTVLKINKYFPYFNIPVISENELQSTEYTSIIIFSYNYKNDILAKSKKIFKKGTKLIFFLPKIMIVKV